MFNLSKKNEILYRLAIFSDSLNDLAQKIINDNKIEKNNIVYILNSAESFFYFLENEIS